MPDENKKEEGKKEEGAKPDLAKEIEALKARNAELDAKLAKLASEKSKEEEDLLTKSKKERETSDKKHADTKAIEKALMFSLKADEFIKTNASLLPSGIEDLFKTANKENYSDPVEKDAALKSGIVQAFFAVQSNVDLLTQSQKTSLDDYLKLTKTEKQNRGQQMYDSLFEPTFEMLKKLKKAEAKANGFGTDNDAETAYKNKLINVGKKHYLGEKTNGT